MDEGYSAISKRKSGHVRIQSTSVWNRKLNCACPGFRPCALQTWGRKLAETKGPKRARVAVARKLAILLHRLWLSETEFRWA